MMPHQIIQVPLIAKIDPAGSFQEVKIGSSNITPNSEIKTSAALPASADWRTVGVITPPKNQGTCDAGWAFSVIAYVESLAVMKLNQTLDLSEELLLECTSMCTCLQGNLLYAMESILISGNFYNNLGTAT
jgi:hypothetical protein